VPDEEQQRVVGEFVDGGESSDHAHIRGRVEELRTEVMKAASRTTVRSASQYIQASSSRVGVLAPLSTCGARDQIALAELEIEFGMRVDGGRRANECTIRLDSRQSRCAPGTRRMA